jgi:hypothetical protein
MATISCDRSNSWNHPAQARAATTRRQVPKSDQAVEAAAEWEFSEAMRSPRLSAAWFVLPSAALSALILLAFLH